MYFLLFLLITSCQYKTEPVPDRDYERRFGRGSILGDEGITLGTIGGNKKNPALTVNRYLWHASLDRLKKLPLMSTDGIGGVIVTDWHEVSPGERFKVTVQIHGLTISPQSFHVIIHKQVYNNKIWSTQDVDPFMVTNLEDAILRQARAFQIAEKE